MTICDSYVDKGLAKTTGSRDKASSAPFKREMRFAPESVKFREVVVDEDTHRCDPWYMCKDIFGACPRIVEIRRASTPELRRAVLRVKGRAPPADLSGPGDASGRGGKVLTQGTPPLLMATQLRGEVAPKGGAGVHGLYPPGPCAPYGV